VSEIFLWFLTCLFAYLASVLSGVVGFGGAIGQNLFNLSRNLARGHWYCNDFKIMPYVL